MNSAANNSELLKLFQNTHEEALRKNAENTKYCTARKEEYVTVKSQLETLPNKLSHDVMVPIGSKALMKGKIVHTNEILVCLGDGWFVKQSAKLARDICDRRIAFCDEMLLRLEKERNLISSRKQLPLDQDAFGNEILEPYDERAESEWRVRHKTKEREYRQQLAQQRKEKNVEDLHSNDEEFWNRLELLELQEEMEGELEKDRAKKRAAVGQAPLVLPTDHSVTKTVKSPQLEDEAKPKRRVSFVDQHSSSPEKRDSDSDSCDESLHIEFSHTPSLGPAQENTLIAQDTIVSPSDIYKMFPKAPIKSILKSQSSIPVSKTDCRDLTESVTEYKSQVEALNLPPVFGDVVERSCERQEPVDETFIAPTRPVSRFRAARQTLPPKK